MNQQYRSITLELTAAKATTYLNNVISRSWVFHARIQRGAVGLDPPPPFENHENHKTIGFLSNADPDPLENHNATKPGFNLESSWARQGNAI